MKTMPAYRLLVWFALLAGSPAPADSLDRIEDMVASMPRVYSDQSLEIRSDQKMLDVPYCAEHIKEAYEFDRHLQGLDKLKQLDLQLTVGLASEATINQFMHSSMGGRAVGSNIFASHANIYHDHPDVAWFTTAHELEHLLMHRLKANEPEVPVYIFEGIACSLGDRYVKQLETNSRYLNNSAAKLASYTSADATDLISNCRGISSIALYKANGKLWQAEHLGGLFIEFLRTRRGDSPIIFFGKFGAIWQDVGNGMAFRTAFQRCFGQSLAEMERQFIAYMQATENNPEARFRGTIYEGIQRQ